MTKLSIIYYSATGHGTAMARRVAEAAEGAGAEVRLRHVAETHDPESFATEPGVDGELRSDQRSAGGHWRRHRLGRRRDLRVADPIRLTDVAIADLHRFARRFVDAGQARRQGLRGFTSSQTAHGGQETTLISLYISLMHFGGIIVPPGYTDPLKFADGNPYGVSHITGPENQNAIDDATAAALDHLARRVVTVADRLTSR